MRKTFILLICITLISCILINSSCTELLYLAAAALIYWWDHGLCEKVGEWVADAYPGEVIWNCNGSGDPGSGTIQHPNDHNNDGDDDYDDDDPDIVLTCEGYELSSWVTMKNESDGYIWGEISFNDETQFVSQATFLPAGIYPGLNITIPIDWEQIESKPYDVNFYFCTSENDLYKKNKSESRLTGLRKANFISEKINYYKSRNNEFDFLYEKYDYDYCLTVNATIDFSITRHEGPPASIEIIKGWNPADSNIVWSKGGRRPYAAWLDTQLGRCSTIAEATAYDDLYIIATDTILGLVDTIGLYIDEPPYCTQTLQYTMYKSHYYYVDGIRGKMVVTYGKLCGEDLGDTTAALSCNWLGIGKSDQGSAIWVQCGTKVKRDPGSPDIDTTYYSEVTVSPDSGEYWYSSDVGWNPFPEGSVVDMKCELGDSGIWRVTFNQLQDIASQPYQIWLTPGYDLQWTSEIHELEDDMGGGFGDTLQFGLLSYRIAGTSQYINKSYGDGVYDTVFSCDPVQWKIVLDTMATTGERIKIWDERPIP